MNSTSDEQKRKRLEALRQEVAQLEAELGSTSSQWQATEYYAMYHATTGFVLGIVGAAASLLFNIVGSLLVNQHPLQLIRVYLTFPLGEKALSTDFNSGMALAIGTCLYFGTGMLLGVPFQMIMARFLPDSKLGPRLALATVLGLLLWAFNFYGILSWLQPMLFGGNWIVDPQHLPHWVGILTHLVFAWTMAIVYPLGAYRPYRRATDRFTTA